MQVITAPRAASGAARRAFARSVLVAILLLAAGAAVGWLCLGTPLVSALTPRGWVDAGGTAVGVLVWGFAIVVPAAFLILGVAQLVIVLDHAAARRPRKLSPHLAAALTPDLAAATNLLLPGGRRVRELVLGPFGIAVLGEVPPPSISRVVGGRWEIRGAGGRWIAIEGPIERTTRDAERIRGWLTDDDRDFLVRVYAVVVTADPRLERSQACAVVAPADLRAWIAALPFQRGLTPERLDRIAAMIRDVAAPG